MPDSSAWVDEVEHRVHAVLGRGGEWVLGCTSVVHAAHDSVGVRDDHGGAPSAILGPTKLKASATEVDNEGITAFIRIGLDTVDVSVSSDDACSALVRRTRERYFHDLGRRRRRWISRMPVCEDEGGLDNG